HLPHADLRAELGLHLEEAGMFEPTLAKKRQRRLGGIDEMVLWLSVKGPVYGVIVAYLAEVCGAEVSKSIIDRVLGG
ncbi:transposase, partial [Streptomyces griseus]